MTLKSNMDTFLLLDRMPTRPAKTITPEPEVVTEAPAPKSKRIDLDALRQIAAKAAAESDAEVAKQKARRVRKERVKKKAAPLVVVAAAWRDAFEDAFPKVIVGGWLGKERGQALKLISAYEGKTEIVVAGIQYFIANWERLNKQMFKGNATVPTLGMLVALHSKLMPEAQRWSELKQLRVEVDQWFKENPGEIALPSELASRYKSSKAEMEVLGL